MGPVEVRFCSPGKCLTSKERVCYLVLCGGFLWRIFFITSTGVHMTKYLRVGFILLDSFNLSVG